MKSLADRLSEATNECTRLEIKAEAANKRYLDARALLERLEWANLVHAGSRVIVSRSSQTGTVLSCTNEYVRVFVGQGETAEILKVRRDKLEKPDGEA